MMNSLALTEIPTLPPRTMIVPESMLTEFLNAAGTHEFPMQIFEGAPDGEVYVSSDVLDAFTRWSGDTDAA